MIMDGGNFSPRVVTNNGAVGVSCHDINVGQWNQVGFTYDGRILKGYVNGVLKDSSILEGHIIYSPYQFGMAIGGSEGTDNFLGLISEVKLWYGNKSDNEMAAEYYANIGLFDGTAQNPSVSLTATYTVNQDWKDLEDYSSIRSDSYGRIHASSDPALASYQWQLVGGNPTYNYSSGVSDFISIPDGGYAILKLTGSSYCMLPAIKSYYISANIYEPFKIKLLPGSGDVVVSKPTEEKIPSTYPILPGFKRIELLQHGNYTVQVINVLGQIIKTGIYREGQLTLNISNAIPGIYFVRIMGKAGVICTEKIFKP